jgi:tetratricopeptide (TPR) repeat protein
MMRNPMRNIKLSLLSLTVALLLSSCYNKIQEAQNPEELMKILESAKAMLKENPDSAAVMLHNVYRKSKEQGVDSITFHALASLGSYYQQSGVYDLAIDHFFKALKFIDENDKMLAPVFIADKRFRIIAEIGQCYYHLNQKELAMQHFRLSVDALSRLDSITKGNTNPQYRPYIFFNIGSGHLVKNEIDSALFYFYAAEESAKGHPDSVLLAGLLSNYGIIYKEKGELDSALMNYRVALEIRKRIKEPMGIASSFNNIADAYRLKGEIDSAVAFAQEAVKAGKKAYSYNSQSAAYDLLSSLKAQQQDYQSALIYKNESSKLKDSIFSATKQEEVLRLSAAYQMELAAKKAEHEHRLELSKVRNSRILFVLTSGFFLLIAALLAMLFMLQRSRSKRLRLTKEKIELQHTMVLMEKENLQQDLDYKNRMLTSDMMHTAQQNRYIEKLLDKVNSLALHEDHPEALELRMMVNEYQVNSNRNFWNEFEIRFGDVHQDFYNNLHENYPDLTPAERRLAAFMKLNLSTKEIAAITHQTPDSVKVARSRLRKKLGMQADENLIGFLQGL